MEQENNKPDFANIILQVDRNYIAEVSGLFSEGATEDQISLLAELAREKIEENHIQETIDELIREAREELEEQELVDESEAAPLLLCRLLPRPSAS